MNIAEIFRQLASPRETQIKPLVPLDTTGFECELIPKGAYINLKTRIIEGHVDMYRKLEGEQQIGELRLETSVERIGDEDSWSFVVRAAYQLDNNANGRIINVTTWWIKSLREAIRLHDAVAKQQIDFFTQEGFILQSKDAA